MPELSASNFPSLPRALEAPFVAAPPLPPSTGFDFVTSTSGAFSWVPRQPGADRSKIGAAVPGQKGEAPAAARVAEAGVVGASSGVEEGVTVAG